VGSHARDWLPAAERAASGAAGDDLVGRGCVDGRLGMCEVAIRGTVDGRQITRNRRTPQSVGPSWSFAPRSSALPRSFATSRPVAGKGPSPGRGQSPLARQRPVATRPIAGQRSCAGHGHLPRPNCSPDHDCPSIASARRLQPPANPTARQTMSARPNHGARQSDQSTGGRHPPDSGCPWSPVLLWSRWDRVAGCGITTTAIRALRESDVPKRSARGDDLGDHFRITAPNDQAHRPATNGGTLGLGGRGLASSRCASAGGRRSSRVRRPAIRRRGPRPV